MPPQIKGVPPVGVGPLAEGGAASSTASPAKPSVPNADDVRLLSAGPDPRGGFAFSFADGVEGGVLHIIAAHMAEMMGLGTKHELNCVQMDVHPRGKPALTLTIQKAGGKSPLSLKMEAVKLLSRTLPALRTDGDSDLAAEIEEWLAKDITALAAAAREGGDVEQAPGEAPQSGHESGNAQKHIEGGIMTHQREAVERLIEAARMYEASCRLGGEDQAFASRKLELAKNALLAKQPTDLERQLPRLIYERRWLIEQLAGAWQRTEEEVAERLSQDSEAYVSATVGEQP